MTSKFAQGGTASIPVDFRDTPGGNLIDPPDGRFDILDPNGVTVASDQAVTLISSPGQYKGVWHVPTNALLGIWKMRFKATILGAAVQTDCVFEVVQAGSIEPPSPDFGVVPWCVPSDLCGPCDDIYDLDGANVSTSIQVASELLFELSGGQFGGWRSKTVRPCSRSWFVGVWAQSQLAYFEGRWQPVVGCGCGEGDPCGCGSLHSVQLSHYPIVTVDQVKLDGSIMDPSLYRVDERRSLVRLPDPSGVHQAWPCCQDLSLPDTALNTWSVRFTWGRQPPAAGVRAAAVLACEFALACDPDLSNNCRLPRRVQQISRQNLTLLLESPNEVFTRGAGPVRTGLIEVDAFLAAYNPHGVRRSAQMLSPDEAPWGREINT